MIRLESALPHSMDTSAHLRDSTGTNGRFIKLLEDLVKGSLEDMFYDAFRMGEWVCSATGVQCAESLAQ